jgi:hypothetical protein
MATFEELNKKSFFDLIQDVLNFPNQSVECTFFRCLNTHFTATKQKEIVEAIIEKKIDPRKNKDCQRAKGIIIEILKQLHLTNEL